MQSILDWAIERSNGDKYVNIFFKKLQKIYAPLSLYLPNVVCQGVYNITTRQVLLHYAAYRLLVGQCKCNVTQGLSLISYDVLEFK